MAALLPLVVLVTGCGAAGAPSAVASPTASTASTASTAIGCAALAPGDQTITLEADGRQREALAHVPPLAGGAGPIPALVALHGYSSNAVDFADYSGLSAAADEAGFVVVYPQALGDPPEWHVDGGWSNDPGLAASDRRLAVGLLDWLVATGCVDPGRIFLTGHSQGGGMAGDLVCDLADRLAGVGLVSALHLHMPCKPSRPVPVFVSHAVDDPILPIDGGRIAGTPEGFPNVLPVENVVVQWAEADGCTGEPERSSDADGVVIVSWTGCATSVVYNRTPSGGHDWQPGVRDAMWTFFAELP